MYLLIRLFFLVEMQSVLYRVPGGGCLAISNFTGDKPSDNSGGTIALEVEDLDRLIDQLKAMLDSRRNEVYR